MYSSLEVVKDTMVISSQRLMLVFFFAYNLLAQAPISKAKITEAKFQEAKKILKSLADAPELDYCPRNGICFARTVFAMGELAAAGIASSSLVVTARREESYKVAGLLWRDHIAPIFAIEGKNEDQYPVFDPALAKYFLRPDPFIPFCEWKHMVAKKPDKALFLVMPGFFIPIGLTKVVYSTLPDGSLGAYDAEVGNFQSFSNPHLTALKGLKANGRNVLNFSETTEDMGQLNLTQLEYACYSFSNTIYSSSIPEDEKRNLYEKMHERTNRLAWTLNSKNLLRNWSSSRPLSQKKMQSGDKIACLVFTFQVSKP